MAVGIQQYLELSRQKMTVPRQGRYAGPGSTKPGSCNTNAGSGITTAGPSSILQEQDLSLGRDIICSG